MDWGEKKLCGCAEDCILECKQLISDSRPSRFTVGLEENATRVDCSDTHFRTN